MKKHPNTSAYIPGECNINEHEVMLRRVVGFIGLTVYGMSLAALLTLVEWRGWRVVLIIPALLAAIGFLQAKYRFCVYYGSKGRQNADPGSKTPHTVTNESALQADQRKATYIKLQAVGLALLATLVALLLPELR